MREIIVVIVFLSLVAIVIHDAQSDIEQLNKRCECHCESEETIVFLEPPIEWKSRDLYDKDGTKLLYPVDWNNRKLEGTNP